MYRDPALCNADPGGMARLRPGARPQGQGTAFRLQNAHPSGLALVGGEGLEPPTFSV
jgi:hypothetical protein